MVSSNKNKSKISSGLLWKLLERFGVSGGHFILQIILARLLDPTHYGILSLMIIFTSLANVFVQNGFNTALIQNRDVKEEDYSSVFWVSLCIAIVLYGVIFLGAPLIAAFYEMLDIVLPLRVLALMLFPGALNSIQLAKISREMDFKKVFYSNIGAVIIAGLVGIAIAYMGGGIWALVAQSLLNSIVSCIVMLVTVRFKLHFFCNVKRVKKLFSYGWKLLVSSLLDTLYQDMRSLVIGKKYDSGTLGYYNRGKQFPQFVINAINGAIQSVMLPAMSAEQDDKSRVKDMMRNSIMLSTYVIFPIMVGLATVSPSLVSLLLTDKWLPCVPYMWICCFSFAFYPVHTNNLQAINAMGRSDIFLTLEIIKKVIDILMLVIAVFCFDSPVAIAMTGAIGVPIGMFINSYPNKKLINYSYFEQIRDILPAFLASLLMGSCVAMVECFQLGTFATLILQVFVGVITYIFISAVFRLKVYLMFLNALRGLFDKRVK